MTQKPLPPGIRKRRGKYQVRYYGLDGKRRARSFARLSDAKRFQRDTATDKDRGDLTDPRLGRTRLEKYAKTWLASKGNARPRTIVNIQGRLDNHILPKFGHRAVASIQPAEVRAWVAGLAARLAPSTVKATFRTFGQIMRTAELDGLIRRSPCTGVELPAEGTHEEMHFLGPEQVAALADAHADRYRAAIYTTAYTGLRAGELWALKLPRVDLTRRRLEVVEALSEVNGRLIVGPTKTRTRRTVSLPAFLVEMIEEHINRFSSSKGYLFTAPEGGPIRHRNYMTRHFYPAVETAGLPKSLRFHDLRHSHAAILISQGANPKQIQLRLDMGRSGRPSTATGTCSRAMTSSSSRASMRTFAGSMGTKWGPGGIWLLLLTNESGARIRPLTWSSIGAGDRTRTGDPHLGKVMLYQLSHARNGRHYRRPCPRSLSARSLVRRQSPLLPKPCSARPEAVS